MRSSLASMRPRDSARACMNAQCSRTRVVVTRRRNDMRTLGVRVRDSLQGKAINTELYFDLIFVAALFRVRAAERGACFVGTRRVHTG